MPTRAVGHTQEPASTARATVGPEPASAAPSCPKCGGEMRERVAKMGKNAGKKFWGCQNFPDCKGIVNV